MHIYYQAADRAGRLQAPAWHQLQKECGEPTCFIFASKLVTGQVTVEQCTPLFTDEHREKREQLLALIQTTI